MELPEDPESGVAGLAWLLVLVPPVVAALAIWRWRRHTPLRGGPTAFRLAMVASPRAILPEDGGPVLLIVKVAAIASL